MVPSRVRRKTMSRPIRTILVTPSARSAEVRPRLVVQKNADAKVFKREAQCRASRRSRPLSRSPLAARGDAAVGGNPTTCRWTDRARRCRNSLHARIPFPISVHIEGLDTRWRPFAPPRKCMTNLSSFCGAARAVRARVPFFRKRARFRAPAVIWTCVDRLGGTENPASRPSRRSRSTPEKQIIVDRQSIKCSRGSDSTLIFSVSLETVLFQFLT